MQTLTQYQYLDRDMIMSGVVDWIVKESPLIGVLPMKTIAGNSYKYNVSLTLPGTAWTTPGTPLTETTGTFEQRETGIYTLIQTGYTDKSQITLNLTQNPETIDIALAAQAMAHEFEKTMIIGQTSVDSNTLQFKGLLRMLAELETKTTTDLDGLNNDQVIVNHATGAIVTLAAMDELLDQIKPGKSDLILCSRKVRRQVTTLSRAAGTSGLQFTDSALFGQKMHHYDGVPIYVSDWLLNNYPDTASSVSDITAYDFDAAYDSTHNSTIIFAMQLGEDKVCGLHAGQMVHEREEFVEDYNAIANRFTWYCGAACFKKFSLAGIVGAGVA